MNKAALFDLASILGIAGLLLFIFNIKYEKRFLAFASLTLMVISLMGALALFILEEQSNELAKEKHKLSPYYLSGYYRASN